MAEPDSGVGVQSNVALRSAELQKAIAAISQPALRTAISKMITDLGEPGMEPASVRREYNEARAKSNAAFETAQKVSEAGIKQDLLQSGARGFTARGTRDLVANEARNIERQRVASLGALDFEEASAGLGQTNYLLSSLLKTGNTAVSGALGYGANAIGAGQIMSAQSQQNRQQGSTYGAMVGTILGALLSGYTGGASIPLGAAAGGAVGGWISG